MIVLDKHFAVVTSLAVSTDGLSLVTAGRDKVLHGFSSQLVFFSDYHIRPASLILTKLFTESISQNLPFNA